MDTLTGQKHKRAPMDGHGCKRRLHGGAEAQDCEARLFKATPLNTADCGDETQRMQRQRQRAEVMKELDTGRKSRERRRGPELNAIVVAVNVCR